MKAREVMKLLNICRTTLNHYTKNNIIKHTKLSNGYYDYDDLLFFNLLKKIIVLMLFMQECLHINKKMI